MEQKKNGNKFIIVIVIVVIIAILGILGYFLLFSKDDNIIKKIFNQESSNGSENGEVSLSYNGVYVYKKELEKSYSIGTNCQISSLDRYIIVVNDDYFVYKSSCMGTYLESSGGVSNLEFVLVDDKEYKIVYENLDFTRDYYTKRFAITTSIEQAKIVKDIDLKNLKFILENTEFSGHYYNINSNINSIIKKYRLLINFDNYPYEMRINYDKVNKYSYQAGQISQFPDLYAVDNFIAIIETVGNRNILKIVDNSDNPGIAYNSDSNFPIVFDGVSLTTNNNIFIGYDSSNSKFNVLIGNSYSGYCATNSDSNEIMSYQYEITYDYNNRAWGNMKFVKIIRANDGCETVYKLMG